MTLTDFSMGGPWARVLLLVGLAGALAACSDAVDPCDRDEDCREGFRCDLTLYAGECVQSVYVIRCGENLCQYGREACVGGECLPLADGGFGRDMSVPFDRGPGLDRGAPDGGPVADRGPGRRDFEVERDLGPEPPSVVITAPFDGSILFDGQVQVIGQVFRLEEGGTVRLLIDGAEPGMPLELPDGRSFATVIALDPGVHTLEVVAEHLGLSDRAAVTVRVDAFVEVRDGRFVQSERPYRFVGLAMPDLLEVAIETPDAVGPLLARAAELGASVIRTRAYDDRPDAPTAIQVAPGELRPEGLAGLDLIVEQAGLLGLKLLLSLGDGDESHGGPPQYLRWAGQSAAQRADWQVFFGAGLPREQFKTYARAIVGRVNARTDLAYRDDPTILGWLILDDLDATGVYDDATGNGVSQFYADVLPVIVANAPRQLVATGDVGFDINPQSYNAAGDTLVRAGRGALLDGTHQVGWLRNLRPAGVDFATITVDPALLGLVGDGNTVANLGAAWIRGHGLIAAVEAKPLVITARLPSTGLSLPDRRQILQAWYDELVSLELAGLVVGDFEAPGQASGRDTAWSWAPGTDPAEPGNVFADLIQAFAADLAGR